MTRIKKWRYYACALLLCGLAVCSNVDQDRPVKNSEHTAPNAGNSEGVTGLVTTSDNLAVEGAFIQPKSLDDPAPPIPEMAVLSNRQGRYTWLLLPGNYRISVSVKGCQTAFRRVVIEAGKMAEADFVLQCEDVANVAVITIGPNVVSSVGIN